MERKQKMGEEVGLGGRGEASASARSEELEKKTHANPQKMSKIECRSETKWIDHAKKWLYFLALSTLSLISSPPILLLCFLWKTTQQRSFVWIFVYFVVFVMISNEPQKSFSWIFIHSKLLLRCQIVEIYECFCRAIAYCLRCFRQHSRRYYFRHWTGYHIFAYCI